MLNISEDVAPDHAQLKPEIESYRTTSSSLVPAPLPPLPSSLDLFYKPPPSLPLSSTDYTYSRLVPPLLNTFNRPPPPCPPSDLAPLPSSSELFIRSDDQPPPLPLDGPSQPLPPLPPSPPPALPPLPPAPPMPLEDAGCSNQYGRSTSCDFSRVSRFGNSQPVSLCNILYIALTNDSRMICC